MSIENADFNETVGVPGLIFPLVPHSIESGFLQGTKNSGGGFALFAKKGVPGKVWAEMPTVPDETEGAEEGATVPDPDAYFVGIAARTQFDGLGCEGYGQGDQVNVLKKGRLWVRVLGEVLAGQAAYVNDTNFAITATSSGATAITGGVFKSNAADGQLAELEIA
ncbi:hypothetical protein [Fibrobacter sp. UWH4]|uniref:structural cement protein Gp24 n=1 Tax=Fibrobacter sp. UWH4 TaxID=1896210 RepID=UPI00091DF35C|nr:hypothetical protein [Fibrobacter sp. UWH4]SHL05151.1 hypothetical protein SAMN05720762_10464 [Fibrobacter sp. UWH4]